MQYNASMTETPEKWQAIQNARSLASKRFFAKIGCVYLLSKEKVSDLANVKKAAIPDFLPHLRKILTTDERVISIEHFTSDDKLATWNVFSSMVPSEAFTTERQQTVERGFRLLYHLVRPFVVGLRLELHDKDKRPLWKEFPFTKKLDKCNVYYNGEVFMAYSDDPQSSSADFGHAARDVLHEVFAASDLLDVKIVGPSPIHPDIEILFFSPDKKGRDDSKIRSILTQPTMFKNNIFVPLTIVENNVEDKWEDMLLAIYEDLAGVGKPLSEFYNTQTIRSIALKKDDVLEINLKIIRAAVERLHSVSSWNILEHRRMTRLLTTGICNTTLSLVDSQAAHSDLSRALGEVRKR